MKGIFTACLLLFSIPALGQTSVTKLGWDELRRNRPEIRAFYEALLTRSLASDVAAGMTANRFVDDDVRSVLESPEFKTFARSVVKSPRLQKAIDRFLDRLLAPGVLERMTEEKTREMMAQRQASLAFAVEELMRAHQRIFSRETEKEPPTLWQRIWNYLSRDLFQ